MEEFNRKTHWETVYANKALEEVSWYQRVPETSLSFFARFEVPLEAKIIDVGGGDSYLVDFLLEAGYCDITVLDVSGKAIARAKERLGKKAEMVKWIVADAADFDPPEKYDFWHDRAAFHFLNDSSELVGYVQSAEKGLRKGGLLAIGTFSEKGPAKCSGISIRQYSADSLKAQFELGFNSLECFSVDHKTPFDTVQNFVFCTFERV
ncbi:class I SAM-dependent methyltransferase [Marinilongibacter aquaticus]|uniref:class I SAM-dependent methyltransferase n=1 Tax=Marinilongibacter aquaticus TaxID=2975157 RepID=UPI0021BDB2AB|nr:class I SAM-dependent methyltransferase [Marinilongibacter aquaticus]UBM58446.1 class I SAM-dependent methyltransferase [Marinilongibacter aquaticus]